MPKRPLAIVLIAVYAAVNAVLYCLGSLLAIVAGAAFPPELASWLGLLAFVLIASAVAAIAVAHGLWTRQVWAPKLTLYTSWLSVALGAAAIFYDRSPGNILLQLVGIVLSLAIIRYIRKPEVIQLFAESQPANTDPQP